MADAADTPAGDIINVDALTPSQLALIIASVGCAITWFCEEFQHRRRKPAETTVAQLVNGDIESKPPETASAATTTTKETAQTPQKRPDAARQIESVSLREAARYATLLALVLFFVWLCDGPHRIFEHGERAYSRDFFFFLMAVLLLFGLQSMRSMPANHAKIVNRDQTEEWRGWMQLVFIMYHYYAAKEVYNFIRVLIAAYVWMTGFGNFSFFWVRGDYSIRRMLKMLFRLNFFVTLLCITLSRQYMLYYICALHTWWFLVVYTTMVIFHSHNTNTTVMTAKFFCLFVALVTLFEVPGVFEVVFSPLKFLLEFDGSLHEWHFRARLDCYITAIGMLCAYLSVAQTRANLASGSEQGNAEANLSSWEKMDWKNQWIRKGGMIVGTLVVLAIWYDRYLTIPDKYAYNEIHRFTSWAPVIGYLILRNIHLPFRSYYSSFFSRIGKITLETYLCQFHVWLGDDAKTVLVLLPNYPLLNFLLVSAIFFGISQLVFAATQKLNDFAIPNDISNEALAKRAAYTAGTIAVLYGICWVTSRT